MSYQRPNPQPMGPVGHFISTVLAVWIGGTLAGLTLFFIASGFLASKLVGAIDDHQQRKMIAK